MKRIHKYKIHENSVTMLPEGAEILKVGFQNDKPVAWALADPERAEVATIYCFFTGSLIDADNLTYIDTFQDSCGCVEHIFKRKN